MALVYSIKMRCWAPETYLGMASKGGGRGGKEKRGGSCLSSRFVHSQGLEPWTH